MSFHRCMSFLILSSVVLFNGIQAVAPPSALELVFPPIDHIPIPNNITIGAAGFNGGSPREYASMFSSINVSVEYPNNTIAWLWALVACADAPNRDSATFLMDQEGLYTFRWNVTYGIPINDVSSTTHNCRGLAFSYQTLFLNKTFTAGGNSDGASIGSSVTTVMSSFATAPTGQVVFSDDARRQSELGLKLMSLVVVVLGAFLLL